MRYPRRSTSSSQICGEDSGLPCQLTWDHEHSCSQIAEVCCTKSVKACAPGNTERLGFLISENGVPKFVDHLELEGKLFVPTDPTSPSWPGLIVPTLKPEEFSLAHDPSVADDIENRVAEY